MTAPIEGLALRMRSDGRPSAHAGGGSRVGIDLVAVADVASSLERFGTNYTSRIFTDREMADTASEPSVQASALAARFAAKEATLKVLRPTAEIPAWTQIEVIKTNGGWCELRLSGHAHSLAVQARLGQWSVSLTHEGPMAAAVVIATVDDTNGDGHG